MSVYLLFLSPLVFQIQVLVQGPLERLGREMEQEQELHLLLSVLQVMRLQQPQVQTVACIF